MNFHPFFFKWKEWRAILCVNKGKKTIGIKTLGGPINIKSCYWAKKKVKAQKVRHIFEGWAQVLYSYPQSKLGYAVQAHRMLHISLIIKINIFPSNIKINIDKSCFNIFLHEVYHFHSIFNKIKNMCHYSPIHPNIYILFKMLQCI